MADDQEKTEEPTDKKIEDARKEGNVPKSQDASGVITLFVAILALLMLFPLSLVLLSVGLAQMLLFMLFWPISCMIDFIKRACKFPETSIDVS